MISIYGKSRSTTAASKAVGAISAGMYLINVDPQERSAQQQQYLAEIGKPVDDK